MARIVHYQSYGTPGGEYRSTCRAAVITAVAIPLDPDDSGEWPELVDLCVLNPEGMFFNQDVPRDEGSKAGGTWHWPERVGD